MKNLSGIKHKIKKRIKRIKRFVMFGIFITIARLHQAFRDKCNTNASGYAIGGILSQETIGKDLPIAYTSRLVNKTEQNSISP